MINSNSFQNIDDNLLIKLLGQTIGSKFNSPFRQIKREHFDNKLFLKKFKSFDYESKFLDEEEEKDNLELVLKDYNINIENYYSLSERVIKIIDERKNFLV